MLRHTFLSSRPARRTASLYPRCLRPLHTNAALQKRQDPTAPKEIKPYEKKLLKRQKLLEKAPDYVVEAFRHPVETFAFYQFNDKVRTKHEPAFLKPEDECPEEEFVPPRRKPAEQGLVLPGRKGRPPVNKEDRGSSVLEKEPNPQVPKRARRRKEADSRDNISEEEPVADVPKKTRRRKKSVDPAQESSEDVNVDVPANIGRPLKGTPTVIPHVELAGISSPREREVLEHLQKGYGGHTKNKALGDVRRVNVTGEDLCDSILERIKPSLTKHEGCDIIDVNPGPGIWSSKLHDILKPRTHILMEPDTDLYQPLLQPLLDAKNSKYVLVPKPGVIWAHLEKVLSTDSLPLQQPLPPKDPRLDKPNNTLLFVANLAYNPKRTFKAFPNLTTLVLHQLMTAVRSHALVHQYGSVRMLIWLTDEERLTPLPRHAAVRKKASIEAELSCGQIYELASSTRPRGAFRREDALEIDSAERVLQKMKEAGVKIPKGRESEMQLHIENAAIDDTLYIRESDDRKGKRYYRELADLEERYAAGEFERYSNVLRPPQTKASKKPYAKYEFTPEYDRLIKLRYRATNRVNKTNVIAEFISRNDEIMDMQKELWGGSGPEHEARCEEVMRIMQEFKDDIENIPGEETRVNVLTYLDNQRLLKQEAPVLLYDRREFEPLKVHPRDFFPRTELALLDFHPKELWPVLREDFPASYDIFEYIISILVSLPGQSVLTGMKALWPGAIEFILPECPSLRNPFKGGDMDLGRLTCRCLTQEMLREIMEAWMRWPWRPSRMELLGRHTSYSGSELGIPGEGGMGGDGEAGGGGSVF